MINLSLTIGSMLAVASMQQKCKIKEMSDTIRRNEHTKNLHGKVGKLDKLSVDFANFAKFVMRFFYTRHTESFVLIHVPSILRSNARKFEEIFLGIAPQRRGFWIRTHQEGGRGEWLSGQGV